LNYLIFSNFTSNNFVDKPFQGTSISESKCDKMLKKEGSIAAIKLSNKLVCKLYPKGI
jgi:hypothetical protein